MLTATLLSISPCAVVAWMIWRRRHFFDRTRRQIRALPEVAGDRQTRAT